MLRPLSSASLNVRNNIQQHPRPESINETLIDQQPQKKVKVASEAPYTTVKVPKPLHQRLVDRCVHSRILQAHSLLNFYSSQLDSITIRQEDKIVLPYAVCALHNPLTAVGDGEGVIRILETDPNRRFEQCLSFPLSSISAIYDIAFSSQDEYIATAHGDQSGVVTDMFTQKKLASLEKHCASLKQIKFSEDKNILASCSRDGDIHIWDLRIRSVQQAYTPVKSISAGHSVNVLGKKKGAAITCVHWLDHQSIASACDSNTEIKVWDLRRLSSSPLKKAIPKLTSPQIKQTRSYGITDVTFDGKNLYALCTDNKIYQHRLSHLDLGAQQVLSHPSLLVDSFYVKGSISKNKNYLAVGNSAFNPVIFDLKGSDKVELINGHTAEVTGVSFTSDDILISISDDRHIRAWREGYNGAAINLSNARHEQQFGCGWAVW